MKKIISLLLAVLTLCLITACGGDRENAGTWTLRAAGTEGLLTQPAALGINALLELEEDGTGRLTLNSFGYALKSWYIKNGQVRLNTLDGPVTGSLSAGYITLPFEEGITLYFAKEGAEVPALLLMDEAGYWAAREALAASAE